MKNSAQSITSAQKVGSSGYTYSYSSGYAKDLLSQNKLLKKWIDACDAAGAGVYVYHTAVIEGQNLTGQIYYYNNNISNATVEVTSGDGAVNVAYTGTEGGGYDLTIVSLYGKKNACKLAWNATVNGAAAATSVKYQNSLVQFDFRNTEKYSVSFTPVLTRSMVYDNDILWKFVKSNQNDTNAAPFIATSERTFGAEGAEKKVYTYVFYLPTIANPYTATMDVAGDATSVNVHTNYTTNTEKELGEEDAKYAMYLVTVTADLDVEVSFSLTMNGTANPETRSYTFEEDPRFVIAGALDTELVRYLYDFNNDIVAILNEINDLETLKLVVGDLKLLLTPQSAHPFDMDLINGLMASLKSTEIKNYVKNEIGTGNLEAFAWMIYCATSSNEVTRKEMDIETGKLVDLEKNGETGEEYTYYSSPYMLYYAWLRDNGYVKK